MQEKKKPCDTQFCMMELVLIVSQENETGEKDNERIDQTPRL